MANIFSLYGTVFIDNEKANKAIDETTKKGTNLSSKVGGALKSIGKAALGLGTIAVATAGTIGTLALNTQQNVDQAMTSFVTQTNVATTESVEWQEALEDIYKGNYGDNFQDIADSMAIAKQQLQGFDATQIKEVTENALVLRDTFNVDVANSVRAAQTLMKQFGISAEEAYNLMSQGAKNGLDFSGELIDSIDEYSVQFNKLGLTANDMFNIFQSGTDAGAWNLDKIGDAVKEFSIRAIDGSKTTIEGFEKINLNADEMAKKFAAGGDVAKDAFYQTIEAIKAMDDPVQQSIVGVNLFGTMWEDLGPDVITQLGSIRDSYDATADSMEKIKEVKYDDIGSMFEALKRNVEMLLLPLGNALMPVLLMIFSLIIDNMPLIETAIESFAPIVTDLFTQLLPPLLQLGSQVFPIIVQLIQQFLPILISLIQMLLPPTLQIVQLVLPIILQLLQLLLPLLQPLLDLLMPIVEMLLVLLGPLLELINVILVPLTQLIIILINTALVPFQAIIELLTESIRDRFLTVIASIKGYIEGLKTILKGIIAFVTGVFSGDWSKAWEGIKTIFKGIVDSFVSIFKMPINLIIDGLNSFIRGLNKLKIPDWVPGVGGKSLNLKTFNKLRIGIDEVPYDDYPALLHKGERVLTASENKEYQQQDNSANKETNIYNNSITVEKLEVRDEQDISRIAEELYYLLKKKEA